MRKLVAIWAMGAAACLPLGACGDDDDDGDPCPDVAGVWTITEHCDANAVGGVLEVQQNGCSVVTNGSPTEFSGSVAKNGQISVQGSTLGVSIQCSGTATSQHVTLNCGACQVTLARSVR